MAAGYIKPKIRRVAKKYDDPEKAVKALIQSLEAEYEDGLVQSLEAQGQAYREIRAEIDRQIRQRLEEEDEEIVLLM